MNNIEGKFLPVGTVVMLKGASKRLMITGFCAMDTNDRSTIYDYCSCLYPEGIINSKQNAVFNHEQIERVCYVGYSDDEERQFKNKLNQLLSMGVVESNSNQYSVTSGFTVSNQNNGINL